MDIIRNNPYRVLGVLANASRKEIERNKSQIKAFAKVGKTPSFPYDFENILGPIDRSEDNLNDAVSKLTFDKDKVAYGLFWFLTKAPSDENAIKYIREGHIDKAMGIFDSNADENSSLINMAVLCLLKEDYNAAMFAYFLSIEHYWENVCSLFINTPQSISKEEGLDRFTDLLLESFPSVNWADVFKNNIIKYSEEVVFDIKDQLKNSKIYSILVPKIADKITTKLNEILEQAENVEKTNAILNLDMANNLEQSCRNLLASLKSILGNTNSTYIRYADKTAIQILNNCIAYYNKDQGNPYYAKNILRPVRFCVRIAEGQIAKDRCKNNFDIIKEAYDNMCPPEIFEDVTYIKEQLSTFDKSNSNYLFARLKRLIDNINSRLINIKQKVGESEKFYYALSTQTIYFAFNIIIPLINKEIEAYDKANYGVSNVALLNLQSTLNLCKPIIESLEETPKKDLNIALYYADNCRKFKELHSAYTTRRKTNNNYSYQSYSQHSSYNKTTKSNNKEKNDLTGFEKWLIGMAVVALSAALICFGIKISNAPAPKRPIQTVNCNTEPPTYLKTNDEATNFSSEATLETEPYDVTYFNTGDMPYRDIYGKGKYDKRTKNYLEIDNGGETDAVVFLETLDGKKIRHAYICKNEKYTMKHIPGGKYIIKIMQGNSWNAQKNDGGPIGGFMEDVSYSKSEDYDPFVYPSYSSGKWGWYSVTLYKTENGNMSTQPISEGDFF